LTLTNTKIEEYVRTYLKVVLLKKLAILHLFCQEASLNFQSPPLSAACLMFGTYLGYTGAERKILNLGKVSTRTSNHQNGYKNDVFMYFSRTLTKLKHLNKIIKIE